jgi:beta-fructofuranosidase
MSVAPQPHDQHRPIYHFTAPANWLNDPNGLCFWQGAYHLFYQHNPHAAVWGPMHWGHAVSDDLLHWRHLPIALAPTPGGPDADGCWSGVLVDDGGLPTIVYSGHQTRAGRRDDVQLPCLATSRDGLLTWQKDPANPVIAAPPADLDVYEFRDHVLWREDGAWRQLIGAGIRNAGGAALMYRSDDLRSWEYMGPLCRGESDATGTIWECPDFFALGDRHALVLSPIPLRRSIYLTGSYDGRRFVPSLRGEVDAGGHFYAPQSFVDPQGRRIMIGWLWEGRSEQAQIAAGWAGAMSLPRVVTARADGGLHFAPLPEVDLLRGEHMAYGGLELAAGAAMLLDPAAGDALDVELELEAGRAEQIEVALRRSPDGEEQTVIRYDRASSLLEVDRARSSRDPEAHQTAAGDVCPLAADGVLRLRILLDRSVLELYTPSGQCLTSRIYPQRPDSQGLAVEARGGAAYLRSADVWRMRGTWDTSAPA